MGITTYEEEVQLRILTGKEVGKLISRMGVSKLAVISVSNLICNVLSSSAIATFIEKGGVAYNFIVEPSRTEEEIAERVKSYGPDAIALMYGGELPVEDLKTSLRKILKAFAAKNIQGRLIFHVRAFLAGGLDYSLEDSDVKKYLQNNELYVYTADLDNGIMIMNKIELIEGKAKLVPLLYSSVAFEHNVLLNKSLAGRSIRFEKQPLK